MKDTMTEKAIILPLGNQKKKKIVHLLTEISSELVSQAPVQALPQEEDFPISYKILKSSHNRKIHKHKRQANNNYYASNWTMQKTNVIEVASSKYLLPLQMETNYGTNLRNKNFSLFCSFSNEKEKSPWFLPTSLIKRCILIITFFS